MDKKNIRIAYIVLCHKNPIQVNRMINCLKNNNTDFYLHVDKKVYHNFAKEVLQDRQVYILSENDSVDVKWGHISMVYAVLSTIKIILHSRKEYDYVWLISGQDFPIKSTTEIDEVLQSKGCYIQMKQQQNWEKRKDLYWPAWLIGRTKITKVLRRIYVEITGGYSKTYKVFKRKPIDQEIYFGASWWTLPFECIKEISDISDSNPHLLKFFSNSLCPDECFFQTLFNMTSYKGKDNEILTYIDWSERNNSPKTLTLSDLALLKKSSYVIARKFDEDICNEVIKELEILVK